MSALTAITLRRIEKVCVRSTCLQAALVRSSIARLARGYLEHFVGALTAITLRRIDKGLRSSTCLRAALALIRRPSRAAAAEAAAAEPTARRRHALLRRDHRRRDDQALRVLCPITIAVSPSASPPFGDFAVRVYVVALVRPIFTSAPVDVVR